MEISPWSPLKTALVSHQNADSNYIFWNLVTRLATLSPLRFGQKKKNNNNKKQFLWLEKMENDVL